MVCHWWVFELKNPLRESADLLQAFNQFETYKDEITELFVYKQALIISDGIAARLGSLSADFQRFMPWKVVEEKNQSKRLYFDDRHKPHLAKRLRAAFKRSPQSIPQP